LFVLEPTLPVLYLLRKGVVERELPVPG